MSDDDRTVVVHDLDQDYRPSAPPPPVYVRCVFCVSGLTTLSLCYNSAVLLLLCCDQFLYLRAGTSLNQIYKEMCVCVQV